MEVMRDYPLLLRASARDDTFLKKRENGANGILAGVVLLESDMKLGCSDGCTIIFSHRAAVREFHWYKIIRSSEVYLSLR